MGNRKRSPETTRRPYTKRQRAEQEEETRRRIIEAAVALHEARGGDATVSEIAQRAGVARVTLYRHFPDELALLTACTSHYLSLNPPPDLDRWASIGDPVARLRAGLGEAYAYHRRTEAMMTAAEHEVQKNPILADLLKPFHAYWATARDVLVRGWPVSEAAKPSFQAALGLALSLSTWRTVTSHHGLSDPQAVSLLVEMIRLAFDPAREWDRPGEPVGG